MKFEAWELRSLASSGTVTTEHVVQHILILRLADACDCRAVKMLCKADADVNVRDLVGRSPLWMAVSKDGHISQVKALLRNKMCEVNFADNREKRTALQVRYTRFAHRLVSSTQEASTSTTYKYKCQYKYCGQHKKVIGRFRTLFIARQHTDERY